MALYEVVEAADLDWIDEREVPVWIPSGLFAATAPETPLRFEAGTCLECWLEATFWPAATDEDAFEAGGFEASLDGAFSGAAT